MAVAEQKVVFLSFFLAQAGILVVALKMIFRGDEASSDPPGLAFLLAVKSRGYLQRSFGETPRKPLSKNRPRAARYKSHHDHSSQCVKRPSAQPEGPTAKRRFYKPPGQYSQHQRENDLDEHIETV